VSYPVKFEADYVGQRNRLSAFFRLILAIPLAIWLYVYAIVAYIAIMIAWFAIVITGTMRRGPFDLMVLANSYIARSDAYFGLLTETYPPFQDEQTRAAGTPDPS
jgi:Domain of unknown function (DUF4389)